MTNIDLITGFLGSGKTTFLKRYVNYLLTKGERICILEFDYGAVNIDMMLLQEFNDRCDLEMVAGGCDYDCHFRRFKTKLIAMGMKKYDRVIIEPSGIFDVDEFNDAIYDDPLCDWYEVGSIISIVDPNIKGNMSEDSEYLLKSQLFSSGIAIISKCENIDKTQLNNAISLIKSTGLDENKIIAKPYGEYSSEDFEKISHAGYRSSSFEKRQVVQDNNYGSVYFLNPGLNQTALSSIAKELFSNKKYGQIERIKGFISSDSKWAEFNMTSSEVNINPIENGQDVVIVIGESLNESEIKLLFDAPQN
ncbi:MAG: GTPase (G3E family) [Bacilli bacterium]|nr:GTPase (G3E family) [Bacilli bacterium]